MLVEQQVLPRELALPGVRHLAALRCELVTPGVRGAVEPAAGRELPFGLGRELLAGPCGIGLGVVVGDVGDGMALAAVEGAARPLGVAPLGAGDPGPPVRVVVEVDRASGPLKDQRAGDEQVGVGAGVVGRVGWLLGQGDVTGRVHESPELGHRDRVVIHPEAVDGDVVDRALLRVEVVRAHAERPARDPGHIPRRRTCPAVVKVPVMRWRCRAEAPAPGSRSEEPPAFQPARAPGAGPRRWQPAGFARRRR